MSLSLDLSASDAKIARAREHAKALQAEVDRVVAERNPWGSRISQVDPDSGWYVIHLTRIDYPREYTLGILFGDVMHNLRCALDYIVTALVGASNAALTNSHQFPVFSTKVGYENRVGNNLVAIPGIKGRQGPLHGVTIGLQDIWDVQPFHRKKDPRGDPLYVVHRFSNADKHRIIADNLPFLQESVLQISPSEGIVEEVRNQVAPRWEVQAEHEVGRIRYAAPFPSNVYLQGHVTVEVYFGTPAFAQEPRGIVIPLGYVDATCDYVAKVVERFKAL
jgi:hypothetical protein